MAIADPNKQINEIFKYIERKKHGNWSPDVNALRSEIRKQFSEVGATIPKNSSRIIDLGPAPSALFISASMEMWHRSVHSFLMSCSLAKSSPIWSSVAGYYSSHYVIRAFCHLLGFYALWKEGSAQITLDRTFKCKILKKAPSSEHQAYWGYLKKQSAFVSDPSFSDNKIGKKREGKSEDGHDLLHRAHANYSDHINKFSEFKPLDEEYLIERVRYISDTVTETPLLPNRTNYPDLDAVHVIAYTRIIKFRKYIDEIVGASNQYWRNNRNPRWCNKYINYQADVTPLRIELMTALDYQ